MGKAKMGLVSCTALIVGACVGSAIFSLSGVTVFYAGASAVVSWAVAALIYMAYGLLLAELSSMYPHSGGIFVFPRRAMPGRAGSFLAFLSGWGYVISNIIAIAFSSIFMGVFFVEGFGEYCSDARIVTPVALALSVAVVLLGGKRSQLVQNILVAVLVLSLLLYCFFAFFAGGFDASAFSDFFSSGFYGNIGFLYAIPIAMVAYGGCVVIPFMVSEVRRPERNIRRSLLLGLLVVAVLYVTVIVAVVGTLPMSVIISDESRRMIPLFASVTDGKLAGYAALSKIISVSGTIALMTTVIALLRVNSHAIRAMSEMGFFPSVFSRENRNGVMVASVIFMTAVSLLLSAAPWSTERLISLGAVLNIVSMAVTILSLIISRRKKKHSDFKAPLGIFLPVAVITVFVICYLPDIMDGSLIKCLASAMVYLVGTAVFLSRYRVSQKRVSGMVVRGKGHGHLHGMPTANLELFEGDVPPQGVWCTKVFVGGKIFSGVTNVGLRPSDDNSSVQTVETLILDFDGDLYGQQMTLHFNLFIRDTRRFENLDQLRLQVEKDIQFCRTH